MVFFALDQDLGGAEDHLGTAGRRNQSPFGKRTLGRIHGGVHIVLIRSLEDGNDLARVGGIAVFERLTTGRPDPFAVDEILENLGRGRAARDYRLGQGIGRHRSLLEKVQNFHANNRGADGQARGGGSGSVCETANHQGHEGTRRKCLRPKAFVVLRVLGGSGPCGCIVKLTHYWHAACIRRGRGSARSHFRNPVHAGLNSNTHPSGDMMVTE